MPDERPSGLFRWLTEAEMAEFRRWARENYTTLQPIEGTWHPAVQGECALMNWEQHRAPKAGT